MLKKDSKAWYSMRRTLPPWRFDELLADLLEFAPKFGIDEVIIKVDTEEFSHGHPTLNWLQEYQKSLFQIKKELNALGITYSLNPWITVGHCDRGRNEALHIPELETAVGHDGKVAKHCSCFLSPKWREYETKLWAIYAETEPHIMWVEDDIRTFNHEPVSFGCFCELHMAKFSERVGKKVNREELVSAMLRPGTPHPWREEYLLMQQEIMIETAEFLAKIVHQVSPKTHMGLMSSGPRQHALEGRDWQKFAKALAGGNTLYSRPPMGNYYEDSLRGFYYSQDSIKITRHVLPVGCIEQTEVENVPFSRYSKSVQFTFLETALSFAYGSHGVTLNLFDHVGTPMSEEAHFGWKLAENKPFLNALATATSGEGRFHGVQVIHHQNASMSKELPINATYQDLSEDGLNLVQALESHGIPTTYDKSQVVALSGQTVRSLSDDEINEFLHGGLFLDGVAAKILVERGFGAEIGLESVSASKHRRDLDWVISAEEFHNPKFGGVARKYLTVTLPFLGSDGEFCALQPTARAEIVSSLVNPDTVRVAPAMVACENSFGGRVVTHLLNYEKSFGVSYCHPFRRAELHGVIDYLSTGCAEVKFECDGAYALAWRKSANEKTILGCFNFNLDDWTKGVFTLSWSKDLPKVERLSNSGVWVGDSNLIAQKLSEEILQICYTDTITNRMPLIVRLS